MLTSIREILQHATPESQGIASPAILKWVAAAEAQIQELHSFMLLRHGKVVAEGWWSPYSRELPHMLFSLSKSFTSTAVGLAVAEGHFSVDDPVISFFPDLVPAEISANLAAMKVRHLLSMSSGHAADTMGPAIDSGGTNWTKQILAIPVEFTPGTHFVYNTGATYLLSAIVQKKTGQKLTEYLRPRLFEPLGIEQAEWEISPENIEMGGFGLKITTPDIARFGQLYLQKGMWQGQQLLSEAWVNDATSKQVSNGNGGASDWTQGYGYQFWRSQHGAYRGDGAFGQYCVVMPEQDAVLAITAGVADMQVPLNLVWDILLPAMQSSALPEDAAAQATLSQKLSSLALPPVSGAASSPTAAKVFGKTYHFNATEEIPVESITLNFGESGTTVTIKTARSEDVIPCGYGQWSAGQTMLFNRPWENEPAPIVSSGAWTADDTFTLIFRFHETPFFQTGIYRFTDSGLTIETRVNVGFMPPQTHILTGTLA